MLLTLLQFFATKFLFLALHLESGSFPRPLSAREEAEAFSALRAGDPAAREKLIRHNQRLVAHIVKKYYALPGDQDDLISIGTIGLMKAVDTFDSDRRARFSTYASRCIENEILMHLRAKKKMSREISLYEPIGTDREGNEIQLFDVIETKEEDAHRHAELKESVRILYAKMESELSQRERLVLKMRYGLYGEEEYTQREIAGQLEKSAIEKLRTFF